MQSGRATDTGGFTRATSTLGGALKSTPQPFAWAFSKWGCVQESQEWRGGGSKTKLSI